VSYGLVGLYQLYYVTSDENEAALNGVTFVEESGGGKEYSWKGNMKDNSKISREYDIIAN